MGKFIATESVDFQSLNFFKELTMVIQELKDSKEKDIAESEHVASFEKIIKHYTNLNITIEIGVYDPCVEIPMINKNNPLVNEFIRDYVSSTDGLKMINAAEGGVIKGSVSLKTGKASGIFADVKSIIHLPAEMFKNSKYISEEIAAITLHEIGHLFTYYEFMSRSVTTNQVLAGLSKALDNSGSVSERESVLINVKKAMKLKDLDTAALAKSNNTKVAEIVVITSITQEIESELGSNLYDFSSWEYLSDQFATRFGAGKHLVTALDKLYKGHWNISFRSLPAYLAMEALKATLVIGSITATVLGTAGMGSVLMLGMLLMAMDGAGDGSYDRPGARMKRVRDQIVQNLKDKKLSADDVQRLTADLETIDSLENQASDRRQFFGVLWDFMLPAARKGRSQTILQKQLEDIAANDLFVKAAALKQFA